MVDIVLVTDDDGLTDFCRATRSALGVGIDCEWRPDTRGPPKATLVQVATRSRFV